MENYFTNKKIVDDIRQENAHTISLTKAPEISTPKMDWVKERQSFKDSIYPLNKNSPIKKKMQLVKRLKNIRQDNISDLVKELSSENMERFYSEIVCSLVSNNVSGINDIKNILRIAMVYCKDPKFLQILMNEISKNLDGAYTNIETYWHLILYIEIKIIVDPHFDYSVAIKKSISKMTNQIKILFLEYLKNCFDGEDINKIYVSEKSDIKPLNIDGMKKIQNKNGITKTNNEKLIRACNDIGVEYVVEKSNRDFVKIIDIQLNEFSSYKNKSCMNVPEYEGPCDLESLKEYVKKNAYDVDKIDSLVKFLRKYENKKIAVNLINSFKSKVFYMVPLARIVKSMPTLCRKIISKSIDDVFDYKGTGINRSDLMCNILFIGELAKYKIISSDDIFNLLDHLFKIKDIETFCSLLENVGRFYLNEEDTNYRMRDYISKIITYAKQAQSSDIIYINDLICRIFPDNSMDKSVKIEDFVVYFINKGKINEKTELFKIFKKNKKFIFRFLIRPWLYTNIQNLAKLVTDLSLENTMIDYIFFYISANHKEKKQKTLIFSQILSQLLLAKSFNFQDAHIKRIISLDIEDIIKHKILISVIEYLPYSIRSKYVNYMKMVYKNLKDTDLDIMMFNFCEQMGEDLFENVEEDSFEEELRMMKGF